MLILNYPGNPDGLVYSEEELKAITKEARALNLIILSDEIYGLLHHQHKHISMATLCPERTITTTGLSKWCAAGGWRFGAAMLPQEMAMDFKKALIGVGSETYSCAPTPVQIAAKTAYQSYAKIQPYLDWQVQQLSFVANFIYREFTQNDIRLHPPQGGFYLLPDFHQYKEALAAKNIFIP